MHRDWHGCRPIIRLARLSPDQTTPSQLALDVRPQRPVDGIRALVLSDEVGMVRPVELREQPLRPVELQERPGDVIVALESLAHRLGLVVVALDQRLAGDVVPALDLGRVVVVGVGAAGGRVQPPAAGAPHDLLRGHGQVQRHVHLHLPAERLGLGRRAREAVEEHVLVLDVLDLREDHVNDEVVRDQAPGVHELLGLLPELGAEPDLRPQHVPCRDVEEAEVLDQLLADGPLSAARRAHDEGGYASGVANAAAHPSSEGSQHGARGGRR
mmetsp:Transcript_77866/g.241328  ORF Transcript_77866/g.241328 Transcript_77866/m.241328 type:complete len:270 (-) Transcript_77866:14-823(-)